MQKETEIEIAQEVRRLEEMCNHYKNVYRKVRLLCCSDERAVAKYYKDYYKKKLNDEKSILNTVHEINELNQKP